MEEGWGGVVGRDVLRVRRGLLVVHPGEGAACGVRQQVGCFPVEFVGAEGEEVGAEVDVGEGTVARMVV